MKNKKHNPPYTKRTCVLCGRSVFEASDYMIGATGRVLCNKCLESGRALQQYRKTKKKEDTAVAYSDSVRRPDELIREMDRSIIGQSDAKKSIALALWKQLFRAKNKEDLPRMNLLLYGPSGCGKTAIVQKAASLAELPLMIVDATQLTETGYRGMDAMDIPKKLYQQYKDHPYLDYSIIFIDEIDKLAGTAGNESRAQYNKGTQHSLLKLIEGQDITFEDEKGCTVSLSTKNYLFLFSGAFTALYQARQRAQQQAQHTLRQVGFLASYGTEKSTALPNDNGFTVEDFVRFGMEPELMGRIGQFIALDALTEDELVQILYHSDLSAYVKYQQFLCKQGVDLRLPAHTARAVARQAEAQHLGARGMNALIEHMMLPVFYQLSSQTLGAAVELQMEGCEDVCLS